jgi:hypothetical protein
LFLVTTTICGATGGVADRENEGDDDDSEKCEKYPAPVADKVILNPGDHVCRKAVQVR